MRPVRGGPHKKSTGGSTHNIAIVLPISSRKKDPAKKFNSNLSMESFTKKKKTKPKYTFPYPDPRICQTHPPIAQYGI